MQVMLYKCECWSTPGDESPSHTIPFYEAVEIGSPPAANLPSASYPLCITFVRMNLHSETDGKSSALGTSMRLARCQ